jgi:predicted nuclease with TOPRIM domain
LIANLQKEIEQLRLNTGDSPTSEVSLLKATVASLKKTINDQNEKYRFLEQEQEDLLLCLADQETEMEELKERLRKYGEEFAE